VFNSESDVDVGTIVEQSRFGAFHAQILFWSFLIMLFDGFDMQALGLAAPAIAKAWHVSRASFAPVFSSGLVGMMIGAALLGPGGDRWGRKPMIVGGAITFSVFALMSAWAANPMVLIVLRFLTGVGIGAAIPNVVALNTEYAPRRLRATMVTIMFIGYTLGGAVGGLVASRLIPLFGWQSVFYCGGIVPLVIALFALKLLPESIQSEVIRYGDSTRARALLVRLLPGGGIGAHARLVSNAPERVGMPVKYLFLEERAAVTLLLWLCYVSNLITMYFILNWLPTIIESAGLPLKDAAVITALFSVGGIAGSLIIGCLLDRGGALLLPLFFGCSAVAVGAFGSVGGTHAILSMAALFAGFFVIGAQSGLNALAGITYPPFMLSTGVGWALGVGRVGSILGPLVGGLLIALQLPLPHIFIWGATPMLVACVASAVLLRLCRRHRPGEPGTASREQHSIARETAQ
jgi:AAHS family 4-hydroxybenzoate transporter-like MFS transporter